MPITPMGDALTEAHRRQQLAIATRAAMRARRDYAGMVVPGMPRTYRGFVDEQVRQIMAERARSRSAASGYFRRMHQIEARERSRYFEPSLRETDENIEERIRTSLYVTGSARPRRHERAGRTEKAASTGRTGVAGAAIRHTMNAGRDQVIAEVKQSTATGFVRITAMDGNVCWFCAMLASRVDYKEGSFDRSDPRFAIGGNPFANAKVHDSCRCMLRPFFDDEIPERTLRYEEQWYELSQGKDDLATNFRRNWEAMVSSSQQS